MNGTKTLGTPEEQERNVFGGTFVPQTTLEFAKTTTPYKNVKQLITEPKAFVSELGKNLEEYSTKLTSGDPETAMETALAWTPMGVGGMIKPARSIGIQKEISNIFSKPKVSMKSQDYANKMFRVLSLDDLARSRPDIARANENLKWYSKISEYGQTAEGGKLCPRSEGCQLGLDKIKKTLGKEYTPEIGRDYEMRVMEEGLQMPCLNCYVWSHQVANDTSASAIIRGTAQFEKLHPDVLKTVSTNKLPNGMNKVALRAQSSTDMTPPMIPGVITQMHDLSAIKGASGAYTKEPARVHITGPAGEYVNMSVSSRSQVGSMDPAEAVKLRKLYPNSSIISVEFNRWDVRRALSDPEVDHVIPNHISGTPKEHLQRKMDIINRRLNIDPSVPVEDFTRTQSDRIAGTTKSGQKRLLNAKEQIPDWEHWGDMNKYLSLAKKRGYIPRFAEFILPEVYEGEVQTLVQEAGRTGSTKKFWNFINKHKKLWDKNYMKLVGPEYGKFGKVKGGYEPIDFNKINMDYAEDVLKNYRSSGVAPDYGRHMELADETIRDFGHNPDKLITEEAQRISKVQSPVEQRLMEKLHPEKRIEQVVRDRTVNPLSVAERDLQKGNYQSAIEIASEAKRKGDIIQEADGPTTEKLVMDAKIKADSIISEAQMKLRSLGLP